MSVEDQLKSIILSEFKSIRAFTQAVYLPYSTVDSIFKRGIVNSGVGTVLKIFSALNLDPESIRSGKLSFIDQKGASTPTPSPLSAADLERLGKAVSLLNREGLDKVLEYAEDLAASGRYTKNDTSFLGTKDA